MLTDTVHVPHSAMWDKQTMFAVCKQGFCRLSAPLTMAAGLWMLKQTVLEVCKWKVSVNCTHILHKPRFVYKYKQRYICSAFISLADDQDQTCPLSHTSEKLLKKVYR